MTASLRPTPFDLVLGPAAAERFPLLRRGIESAGRDPRDRDAFALVREVVEFLQELRPDDGLGAAVDGLLAFVHAAYLFWLDGAETVVVGERRLTDRLAEAAASAGRGREGRTVYVQLPPLRVWGLPVEAGPPEPLDGWFGSRAGNQVSLLAVFGLHPGREGFTAVPAAGGRPVGLVREDGTPLFSPRLEGGGAAGLFSIAGQEELLELAWRLEEE
jgi:hypothetical protein